MLHYARMMKRSKYNRSKREVKKGRSVDGCKKALYPYDNSSPAVSVIREILMQKYLLGDSQLRDRNGSALLSLSKSPARPTSCMWLTIVLVLLIASIGSACGSRPVTSGPVPDFTLDSLDGSSITLSSLEGQVVILDFWATWCSPCVESLDHLQQSHEQFADRELVVLAVNVGETPDEIAGFVSDLGYTFTVLVDSDDRVTERYGVKGIPHTLIVDRDGEVHAVLAGADDIEATVLRLLER